MSDLAAPPRPVVLDPETTRAELVEAIARLNAEAKLYSRRGYIGIETAEYRRWHERLNDALDTLTDYETKAHASA